MRFPHEVLADQGGQRYNAYEITSIFFRSLQNCGAMQTHLDHFSDQK